MPKNVVDAIVSVETFIISIPREVPYLGPLKEGEAINARGYLIRKGNRTIYPSTDMTLLIKVIGESGKVGWGECYGIVAPEATKAIIDDVLGPVIIGRDPGDAAVIHEDLYDLMRVRGFFGGYYLDALAGVDIALWDLTGKNLNVPVSTLLGGRRHDAIRAYVSGLPKATLKERCDLAAYWVGKGYKGIKFAAVVSEEDIVKEMAALREAVGPDIDLMVDLHWKFEAGEAIRIIRRLEPYNLYFAEAPVQPENLEGQARVAAGIGVPLALGEELRTVYEYRPRFEKRAMSIVQPEMGHTGITEFIRIGQMAQAFHMNIMPHASISVGIFMAASLQAASALQNVTYHEYQHSIFDRNLTYTNGDMASGEGTYVVPTGAGLGVEPKEEVFEFVIRR
ncbi:mandelate racemase/muconate lactonizing enzyme family protein [Neorhizobium galegae]|uniref:mandelate racemase/muconate lactonizing enzyme family protein n=1 Tax=Neorhizobium galegae TaxID=399 RepID=UPI0006210820|nr:mandelate racemase/muconate lactonizing enzyme family protein [Neorhizobium galegae]CDZ25489.1 Mandelate racemase/muconate lactonizing protein [Neorhizobium galegae bv. officinalis]KAA9387639.1 mandelate racemase/muconate lactonizing enzyme family protein [Neorhizobium galegae]KAB1110319.1 mandelate racemase/muconate lactonizing enzyme family protein [Neorhizobium galegae]MCM2499099.1 mandelate racemase/muconate lactonizing enzyme family protein [Neorhizobium galegae]MCQ1772793.1 mandelate 